MLITSHPKDEPGSSHAGTRLVVRNHVTFESTAVIPIAFEDVVEDFRAFWMENETRKIRGPHRRWFRQAVCFEFSSNAKHYHRVYLSHVGSEKRLAIASHFVQGAASRTVSSVLDHWLVRSFRFTARRWYSDQEWRQQVSGSE